MTEKRQVYELSTLLGWTLAIISATACGSGQEEPSTKTPITATIRQAASVNGAACLTASDCISGYCDDGGHCAACTADGDCAQGAIGTPGGQYCSSTGVCVPRKADGQLCLASSQCSGPGCYAARQCVNGCCDNLNFCHGYATGDKLCLSGRRCDDGNPCHTGGTVNTSTNPNTCTGATNLAASSSCDPDMSTCTTDQCVSGTCTHAPGNAGATCHTASGDCDSTTTCAGTSATCPSGLKPEGTVCRASSGGCDAAETCTGTSATCPQDGVAAAGTLCGGATSGCAPVATCPGSLGHVQTVTLTNPTGGASRTDFQVRLEILSDNAAFWNHLDGGAAATGHDIRVRDAGGSELSFWIEQLDTSNKRAWIWIKVPSIAAPPSSATLRILYGDASRAAASDIAATMVFGDEFSGGAIDTSKWVIDSATGLAVGGGRLTATNNVGRLHSVLPVSTGVVLETKFQITDWNHHLAGVMVNGVRNTGDTRGNGLRPGLDLEGRFVSYWNKLLWTDLTFWSGNYATSFARSSIAVLGGTNNRSTLTTWSDGSNAREETFSLSYTPSGGALMLGKRYDDDTDGGTFTAKWDWAFIRKYAAVPPTVVANSDEMVNDTGKACPSAIAGECGSVCTGCVAACQATNVSRIPVNAGQPFDLASDGSRIYWTDAVTAAIESAAVDGTSPTSIVSGLPGLRGLAIDDTFVYFSDILAKTVSRVSKSGGTPQVIAADQRTPFFLVSDGGRLLWANQGTGHLDGSLRQYTKATGRLDSLADRQPAPWTIMSTGGRIYWSDKATGAILTRASISDPVQTVMTGLRTPALAASGSVAHFLAADGRAYDVNPSTQATTSRALFGAGGFSIAANEPSLFWTNGISQTVSQQLTRGEYPSTIWRRGGTNVPRVIRYMAGAVQFSVFSAAGMGSIFRFIPDVAGPPLGRQPACPPGGSGQVCDLTALPIVPFLECVAETADHQLVAHFGYTNLDQVARRVGVGSENQVDRDSADACQPTTFAPGTHHDVFAVGFTTEVQWIVGTRAATAMATSPRCAAGAVQNVEVSP